MRLLFGIFLSISQLLFASQMSQQQCKDLVTKELPKIAGWCTSKKAEAMIDLVFEIRPAVCVEMGVFGGSSLLPIAYALKCVNHGVVYAIDAWDTAEAVRYYPGGGVHHDWWTKQNLNAHHQAFMKLLKKHQLNPFCIALKETFATAVHKIPAIDILHIDATHTNEGDFIDAIPYIRKVKNGGYIWFDGWANSPDTYEYLKSRCFIRKVVNSGNCILLQKVTNE